MKQRNVMVVVLLSLVTLGIYDLYWLVQTKKVLNQQTPTRTPTIWLLFAPVLLLLALILISTLSRVNQVNSQTSSGGGLLLVLIYMLGIFAIVPITFYWFFKFSKSVHEYTHGELSLAVTFLLLYVLRFLGLAIVQDKFNEMAAQGPAGPAAPMPPAPGGPTPPPTPPQVTQPTPPNDQNPPQQPLA